MANDNETVRELCAEMCNDEGGEYFPFTVWEIEVTKKVRHLLKVLANRILAAHEREIAAKDAEIEAALRKQNDYHAALLTICTADKDAEGLREIAIDACNGKIADHNRVAKAVRESEEKK